MGLFSSEIEVWVSFEDLDPMNVVWHGNYMRYMEKARCHLFAELGYSYKDMKKDGYAYPIAKMDVKYIKPAKFEDTLLVKTEILSIEPALNIKYFMYNKRTGEKIFEASTMQIAVNPETGESIYVPPSGLVRAIGGAVGDEN